MPILGKVVIAGVVVLMVSEARAAQQLTCPQIVGLSKFAGGKNSPEDLAKKLNTDVETVRNCLEKKAPDAKDSPAPAPATK